MATTYRDSCGSLRGMIDHQSAGEEPCGWCASAEMTARLSAEAITRRPANAGGLEPVSEEQARINAAVLLVEVEAYERSRCANPSRHLAPVPHPARRVA
jgi:hypothetical protein